MNGNWNANILCIRADNMGDLIMSGPAIRALKETFDARITVLTSSMAMPVAKLMEEIDDVIIFDFPWVKNDNNTGLNTSFNNLVKTIHDRNFDVAIVFSVYSQNPMPAIMLAYLSGIPNRLAYCRENPYQLLTNWIPDPEPYTFIRHQVRRDLDLVANVGAFTANENLHLQVRHELWDGIKNKLIILGFNLHKKWLVLHAGVSETKREFPLESWVEAAKQFVREGYQVLFTGSGSEKRLTDHLQQETGINAFSTGGMFNIDELVTLISKASVLLTVNTGTVHIAAATRTPVVVLYALTNPQHTPWKMPCRVLSYQVEANLHSKNEVVKYVNQFFYREPIYHPHPVDIVNAVNELISNPGKFLNQELCLIELMQEHISLP